MDSKRWPDTGYILTIDPGRNTAIALWKGIELISCLCIRHKDLDDHKEICKTFNTMLFDVCGCTMGASFAFIEGVSIYQASLKSLTSASRGDLTRLAMMVGYYETLLLMQCVTVTIVPPQDWKGQLPDDVIKKRVERVLPSAKKINIHQYCAIGIGLSLQGRL
jgi:hypothetical protein